MPAFFVLTAILMNFHSLVAIFYELFTGDSPLNCLR